MFVSTTSTVPVACAGLEHVICVSLTVTTLDAAAPPTTTWFAPAPDARKPLPVRTSAVPPSVGPLAGASAVSTGGTRYAHAPASAAAPLRFATRTSTLPAAPAGTRHVMRESVTVTTSSAATPPKVTWFAPGASLVNPVPVSVAVVPPLVGPLAGASADSVGVAWKRKPFANASLPFSFSTSSSTVAPAVPAGAVQVSVASSMTATAVAATPPNDTRATPAPLAVKPLPRSVTRVPPLAGP